MKTTGIALSASLCLLTSTSFALNPVLGIYTNMGAGVAYTPNVTATTNTVSCKDKIECLNLQPASVTLNYKLLGNVFGGIGYQWEKFRAEFEVLGSSNKIKTIDIGLANGSTVTLEDSAASGDIITFSGNTYLIAGLLNGYYQFYTPGQTSSWVPYVGVGVGFGSVSTSANLDCNPTNLPNPPVTPTLCNGEIPGAKVTNSGSTAVGQIMLGTSYFMDDYSTIFLDYRYITSGSIKPLNTSYKVQTFNIGFNFAMDNFLENA